MVKEMLHFQSFLIDVCISLEKITPNYPFTVKVNILMTTLVCLRILYIDKYR